MFSFNLLYTFEADYGPLKFSHLIETYFMKAFTFFYFLTCIFISNAQLTNVPDVNFELALINLGYDAGPTNGSVPTSNINTITSLNVFNGSISDLTGIEDFVALEFLNCGGNTLISLDVTQNTVLTELYCNANNLNSLDITQNIDLIRLNVSANNLISLDVSQNDNLLHLNTNLNNLGSINISNLADLSFLRIAYNPINTLDISTNTNLDSLYCETTNLSTLDISNNTALIYLDCSGNNLTSLDVSGLTLLEGLTCYDNDITSLDISDLIQLNALFCWLNQLSSLDITNNQHLIYLSCMNNMISSLDVSNNPNLELFRCSDNLLTSLDLSQNPNLETIECDQNSLTSLDVSENPLIWVVKCHNNALICLNIKNGNNLNMFNGGFNCTGNIALNCIEVDNVSHALINWSNIPIGAAYSVDCNNSCSQDGLSGNIVNQANEVKMFPNPTKGSFQLSGINNFEKIEVLDLNGRIVFSSIIEGVFNVNLIESGNYIIKIYSSTGISWDMLSKL